MGPTFAFSIDQLMELAGLAVAQAVCDALPPSTHRRALVLCGPGNNGGDGLVAARHLAHFGYDVAVVCPPPASGAPRKELYARLLTQLETLGVPILPPDTLPPSLSGACDLVIDAVFGFSFRGVPRPPYAALIDRLRPSATPPPVVCVDLPSGWDVDTGVDTGGKPEDAVRPSVLISLTAPKPATSRLPPSAHHYVGGRFVPPSLASKYQLTLPAYPGAAQVVRVAAAAAAGAADLAAMRADYGSPPPSDTLDPVAAGGSGDPMADFEAWFAGAVARGGTDEPNAMCLATCSSDGSPAARYVLLKGVDPPTASFHFYTNHASRKARDLDRPGARAALVFYWEGARRSVRVEGAVSRLPASEADAYFASRPRASQVGAHASRQSARLAGGRAELEAEAAAAAARFADEATPVPRPVAWGGYAVTADRVEFWTGRSSRLHERLEYTRAEGGGWERAVLAP